MIRKPKTALLKTVILKTLPVMAGYLVLGTGFGILFESKGYGFLWSLLMSGAVFAGSMQYVAIDLIAGGASLLSTALMTLMVNARHLFYGISMVSRYRGAGSKKPYLMFALTDETYSLICSEQVPEGTDSHTFYFLISFVNQCYWVTGSVVGGLIGSLITFDTAGLDFAMTALFISIYTEQWLTAKNHLPALIGIGATLLCLLIFGAESFLIPAMLVIITAMCSIRPLVEKAEKKEGEAHAE